MNPSPRPEAIAAEGPAEALADSLANQPRAKLASATSLMVAKVTGVTADAILLELNQQTGAARQAASCLLQPEVGDLALCSNGAAGLHVLHLLERGNASAATLSVPGTETLVVEQPAIEMRAGQLEASAREARMRFDQVHLFARMASAVATGLDLIASRLKRVARQEFTTVDDSVRTVRNLDTLRAGQIVRDAKQAMTLRSDIALLETRGDLRVNGERITMG